MQVKEMLNYKRDNPKGFLMLKGKRTKVPSSKGRRWKSLYELGKEA
jgi:hypothetical protein